tara:strand:+ start:4007 stop:4219 length:213 start_codon:yes stop_codon:yes gene_type:complete
MHHTRAAFVAASAQAAHRLGGNAMPDFTLGITDRCVRAVAVGFAKWHALTHAAGKAKASGSRSAVIVDFT